ncbi:Mce-associated membrane protein [Rhodococcus sp. 27YEA15]|uniref:hypothetical protein n=1 Tax=Rhodococcus sp. 27YEA15 TaxID=3156259 RepID=UPI003C7DB0C5
MEDLADRTDRVTARWALPLAGGASALMLVGALLAGFFTIGPDRQQQNNIRDLGAASGDMAVRVLTYRASQVEDDIAASTALLTGDFRDYFIGYTAATVIPQARQLQISTTWKVVDSAVVQADVDTATTLVYLDGQTFRNDRPDPIDMVSSLRLHLVRVDGNWLIDGLDAL